LVQCSCHYHTGDLRMDDLSAPFSSENCFRLVFLAPLGCCASFGWGCLPRYLRRHYRSSRESHGSESNRGKKDLGHSRKFFWSLKLLSSFGQIPPRSNLFSLAGRRKLLRLNLNGIYYLETLERSSTPLPPWLRLGLHLL